MEDLFQKADILLFRDKQWQQAEEVYKQILTTDPKNIDALNSVALCKKLHLELEEPSVNKEEAWNEVKEAFMQSLKVDKLDIEANFNVGLLNLQQKNDLNQALFYFQQAVKKDKSIKQQQDKTFQKQINPASSSEAGLQYLIDLQEAYRPQLAKAYYNIGMIQDRLGEIHKASSAYKKSIEKCLQDQSGALIQQPHYLKAVTNYAVTLEKLGKRSDAIKTLDSLKGNFRDEIRVYNNLGIIYKRNGNIDAAESNYEIALTIDSDSFFPNYNMGVLKTQNPNNEQESLKQSLVYFEKALKIAETQNEEVYQINVLVNIALVHERLKEDEQAVAYLEKALVIDSENQKIKQKLIQLKAQIQKLKEKAIKEQEAKEQEAKRREVKNQEMAEQAKKEEAKSEVKGPQRSDEKKSDLSKRSEEGKKYEASREKSALKSEAGSKMNNEERKSGSSKMKATSVMEEKKVESVSKDSIKADYVKYESGRQDSVNKDSIKKGSIKQESVKGSVKSQPMKYEALQQQTTVKNASVKPESIKQDPLKQESVKKDSIKPETQKQSSVKQESVKQESVKESFKESVKDKSAKQESVKESMKQESEKQIPSISEPITLPKDPISIEQASSKKEGKTPSVNKGGAQSNINEDMLNVMDKPRPSSSMSRQSNRDINRSLQNTQNLNNTGMKFPDKKRNLSKQQEDFIDKVGQETFNEVASAVGHNNDLLVEYEKVQSEQEAKENNEAGEEELGGIEEEEVVVALPEKKAKEELV